MTTALASAPSKIAAGKRASNARARHLGSRKANIALGLLAWVTVPLVAAINAR